MGNIIHALNCTLDCNAIIDSFLNCTVGRWAHVCDIEQNLEGLKLLGGELKGIRDDTIRRIKIAEWQGKERLNRVEQWLSMADNILSKIDMLVENSQVEIDRLVLGGCCSTSCISSYKFGTKIDKISKEVDKLLQKAKEFNEVAGVALPETKVLVPVGTIVGLETKLNCIISYLLDTDVAIVGIFGEGEVGKTTLLREVNNSICFHTACSDFDLLILIDVSKQSMNESIQNHIGKKIGLIGEEWTSKSLDDKARDILNVLKTKKFVLLLDNISQRLDLTEIGIPSQSINMFCKVVFTTHSENICRQMSAQKDVKLEPLGFEDSWRLFSNRIGQDIQVTNPEIYALAKKLVEECCGLPKNLIKLAQDMAGKNTTQEWTDASKSWTLPGLNLQEEIIESSMPIDEEDDDKSATTSEIIVGNKNVFGRPITNETLREFPRYANEKYISPANRAAVALEWKTKDGKDVHAREYAKGLQIKFGDDVATVGLFYNATGCTLMYSGYRDWYGSLNIEQQPMKVENGEWGEVVHTVEHSTFKRGGSSGAIVYTGENASGNKCDWLLAWHNPSIVDHVHAKVINLC